MDYGWGSGTIRGGWRRRQLANPGHESGLLRGFLQSNWRVGMNNRRPFSGGMKGRVA